MMKNLLETVIVKECTTEIYGFHFLCIIGKHINGGFLAVPNWNICIELSDDANDFAYNSDQIYNAIQHIEVFNGYYAIISFALAEQIREIKY